MKADKWNGQGAPSTWRVCDLGVVDSSGGFVSDRLVRKALNLPMDHKALFQETLTDVLKDVLK